MAAPDKSLSGLLARIHRDHAPGAAVDEEKVDKSDIVRQVEAQHAAANALLRRVGGESAEPPTVVRIDGGRMWAKTNALAARGQCWGDGMVGCGRASLCQSPPAVLLFNVAPREEGGGNQSVTRTETRSFPPKALTVVAAITRLSARMATLSASLPASLLAFLLAPLSALGRGRMGHFAFDPGKTHLVVQRRGG